MAAREMGSLTVGALVERPAGEVVGWGPAGQVSER
jgi:hypothetical protein